MEIEEYRAQFIDQLLDLMPITKDQNRKLSLF